eukprot:CAMPEP_0170151360 /NCGR_PEP_ID=MMETSP0033_2-20121228/49364_1 /TAXON_ID=195969 /ORGANISM="Dolichomastix tenuilepis, Strain CCMP3274" /LENGTH=282 /DNA_ID=CAMNT_0010388453 /DNA_START=1 /DNA_END=846 /DNA_ORIENTATION=+
MYRAAQSLAASDPERATFLGNSSAALYMLRRYDETVSDVDSALAAGAAPAAQLKLHLRKARALVGTGSLAAAAAHLRSAIEGSEIEEDRATLSKEAGGLERAVEALSGASEALESGDPSRATELFKTATAEVGESDLTVARIGLARAELALGHVYTARKLAQELVETDRANTDAQMVLSQALLCGGSTDQALRILQEALRSNPDHHLAMRMYKQVKAAKSAEDAAVALGRLKVEWSGDGPVELHVSGDVAARVKTVLAEDRDRPARVNFRGYTVSEEHKKRM